MGVPPPPGFSSCSSAFQVALMVYHLSKVGKFLNKLWCYVSGEYDSMSRPLQRHSKADASSISPLSDCQLSTFVFAIFGEDIFNIL